MTNQVGTHHPWTLGGGEGLGTRDLRSDQLAVDHLESASIGLGLAERKEFAVGKQSTQSRDRFWEGKVR